VGLSLENTKVLAFRGGKGGGVMMDIGATQNRFFRTTEKVPISNGYSQTAPSDTEEKGKEINKARGKSVSFGKKNPRRRQLSNI